MSEDQEKKIDDIIIRADNAVKKAEKAHGILIKILWITIIPFFGLLSGGAVAIWQGNHNAGDIVDTKAYVDYVRQNAYNKQAAIDAEETRKAELEAITSLISDPDKRKIVEDFNKKTDLIMNRIMSRESEIVPRGVKTKQGSMIGGSR